MQTSITQISDVEFELEIEARAEDLELEFKEALRRQKDQARMKGFRPGKVPLNLVKKMHGRALAYGVAEKKVQEIYESEILKKEEYNVIGQPRLTELDYDMDSDLRAVIRFGVRPEVQLADLSGEKLPRLIHDVDEKDVEEQVERLRKENADLVPVEDGTIEESDRVVADLQRVDEASGTPLIGDREEDVTFFMDDDRLHDELRGGLLGKKAGDAFQVDLPHGSGEHVHMHRYRVTVKEVKRRELPDLDDAFVEEVTKGRVSTVDELRADLRRTIEKAWEQRSREILEGRAVERMLELHPVPVPDSAVELYLDSFVADVRQRNEGKLPQHFDEESFRAANRGEAERHARWMLIRDALIDAEQIEVSEKDLDEYFENAAAESPQLTSQMLRQYYKSMNMLDRVEQQLLSRKVFDVLLGKFELEDKDSEAFEAEMKERRAKAHEHEEPALISTAK